MSKQDTKMAAEANKIIKGIITHQKNATDRLNGFQAQVDDLKRANKLLTESLQTSAYIPNGDDSELKQFIKDDGTIQTKEERAKINIPGTGTVTYKQAGLLDTTEPVNDWHQDLIRLAQKRAFVRMIMPDLNPQTPKSDLALHKHLKKAPSSFRSAIQKSFFDGAGSGAEWIDPEFKPELWEGYTTPRNLRSLIQKQQVDSNVITIPRLNRGGTPYLKGVATSDDPSMYLPSQVQTSAKSVNIKGMALRFTIDDAAMEDSAINVADSLARNAAESLESAWEDAAINASTSAVHPDKLANWNPRGRWDSGLGGPSDHRRCFTGFRHAAIARGTSAQIASGAGTSLVIGDILTLLGNMGEYGAQNRYIVTSPEVVIQHIFGLTELIGQDSAGPLSTLISGAVGSLFNVPVLLSRFMTADMNATGLYDNVVTNRSGIIAFNSSSWYQYERRGITTETSKDIRSGAVSIVCTQRCVLDTPDLDTAKNVSYINNIVCT
jgi:HK97 family phage major capsid protein